MGGLATYIASGKYKVWKDVVFTKPNAGVIYPESEIKPVAGSKIKLFDILRVKVVDDAGIGVGTFYQDFYLYDFEKYGTIKTKYVVRRQRSSVFISNKFYDPTLEDKLGGDRQTLG